MWSSLVIGRVWVLNMFLFCIIYSLGNYTGTNTIKMEQWKIENNVLSLSLAGPAISFPLLQLNFRSENDYENIECATQRSIQLLLVLERRSGCACPYKNVLLASKRHLCLDSSVKYSCGTWDDAFCSPLSIFGRNWNFALLFAFAAGTNWLFWPASSNTLRSTIMLCEEWSAYHTAQHMMPCSIVARR